MADGFEIATASAAFSTMMSINQSINQKSTAHSAAAGRCTAIHV